MSPLITISAFYVIVPLLACIFLYKRLPEAIHWLTGLMTAWFLAEVFAYILRVQRIPNWNVYALLRLAEIITVTMFYKKLFISYQARTLIVWFTWIGIAVAIAEYAYMRGPANTFTILYESIFFIAMGLYACFEMITMNTSTKYLLVNLCLMALFLGSAIYLSCWQFLNYDVNLFKLFGDAHAYLLVICYSLFTISIWRLQV